MEQQKADRARRVVIRDSDYYGGDIYVTDFPLWEMEIPSLRIVWEAYQGGEATLILQDVRELRSLAAVLLEAADTIDPDKEES
jgi:hypothetical protein